MKYGPCIIQRNWHIFHSNNINDLELKKRGYHKVRIYYRTLCIASDKSNVVERILLLRLL